MSEKAACQRKQRVSWTMSMRRTLPMSAVAVPMSLAHGSAREPTMRARKMSREIEGVMNEPMPMVLGALESRRMEEGTPREEITAQVRIASV